MFYYTNSLQGTDCEGGIVIGVFYVFINATNNGR